MGIRADIWRLLVVLAFGVLAVPAPGQDRAAVVPAETGMDAVFGRPVVFRVSPTGQRVPATVEVKLDDGHTVIGEIQWVRVVRASSRDCTIPAWLPQPLSFEAFDPADARAGSGIGSWMMRLAYPLTSSGQGFWMGGVRYEPNWLPDPRRLVAQGVVGRAWSSPLTMEQQHDPLYTRLIEPYRDHPLAGWRFDLAMDVFEPGVEFNHPEDGGPILDLDALAAEIDRPDPFDPITRELGRLERARWQVALARLWNADPTLSLPVRERLVGAIVSPGGLLPAWVTDQYLYDDLLHALLDPRSTDERRASHAKAWLDGFDDAIAWVVDDAGRQDALTGAFIPTIGAVNMANRAVLAWARASDLSSPSDLAPLMPRQVQLLRGEVLPTRLQDPQSGLGVEVQVGDWAGYLPSVGIAIPASPPGFAIGPLRASWTLDAWRAGNEDQQPDLPRDQSAAVLLSRGPVPDAERARLNRAVGENIARETWTIYLEAKGPDDATGHEFVELWFGPFAEPILAIRVHADGHLTDVFTDEPVPDLQTKVNRLADRWVATLELPARVIETGQIVRVGVVREDTCGRRSSWPRRLLPGQSEPGRVAVRLDAWTGYDNR